MWNESLAMQDNLSVIWNIVIELHHFPRWVLFPEHGSRRLGEEEKPLVKLLSSFRRT